jgi:hypothetical protein
VIALTYFPSLREPHGQRRPCSWVALCRWLSSPVISADKHAVAGFSVATYKSDRRAKANVEQVFAVGLDFDEDVDLDVLRERFAESAAFVHTTWSSTLAIPRARVFLALSRPVTGPEYERVWTACAGVAGLVVDSAARDPSRFWFRPSVQAEGRAFVYWSNDGAPVDVDAALAAVLPPPPPPATSPRPLVSGGASAFDRARSYLAKCEPAIQGSGGRTTTFITAQRLVRGFALSVGDAFTLMQEWNQRCVPPWSDHDLRVKCEEAAKSGRFGEGDMLERGRT